MRGERPAIIHRALAGEADEITDAAGSRDALAKHAVSDLALLDGVHRFLDDVAPEVSRGLQGAPMGDLKTAVGYVPGLRPRQEIGMIALDAGRHQRLDEV